jgi:hypothetical protein
MPRHRFNSCDYCKLRQEYALNLTYVWVFLLRPRKEEVTVTLQICIVSILDYMKISEAVVFMMGWMELTTFAMAWSPCFLRLTLLLKRVEIVRYGKQRGRGE